MNKSLVSGVGVAAALVMTFGLGSAGADNEYVGQTYEKAAASISRWGTPVIWTREGSYLPTEKCVVVGSKTSRFRDSSGRRNGGGKVLLDLNCNDTSAQGGHPGNSMATPEGKAALKARKGAIWASKDFADKTAAGEASWCEEHILACKQTCQTTGACSSELLKFLGM